MPTVYVYLLPNDELTTESSGQVAVMVDVIRASSTIVYALANGASSVYPIADVSSARALRTKLGTDTLLGGERGGKRIDGFDLGNSPAEYVSDVVHGRQIVFTTSHGTNALERMKNARLILIGSFLNLNALAESILKENHNVYIVCAGTGDQVSIEDSICAGNLVRLLSDQGWELGNDAALLTRAAFDGITENKLFKLIEIGRAGGVMRNIGHLDDITRVLEMNKLNLVPQVDTKTWRILVNRSCQ